VLRGEVLQDVVPTFMSKEALDDCKQNFVA
jgi:hypothetical protein